MPETVDSNPGGGANGVGDAAASVTTGGVVEAHGLPRARGVRWTWKMILGAVIGAAVLIWLIVKAAGDIDRFVVVTLNGITLSALYFVVASGFTLIFGLMRVVNMAHGSLYLFGGYIALKLQEKWFAQDTGALNLTLGAGGAGNETQYSVWGWLVPLLVAVVIIGVLGVIMQQVFLRWNQGQDLRQALITIALSVIFADQMLAAYGGIAQNIEPPASFPTSVNLYGDVRFGFFRGVIVLGSAIVIGLGLWLGIMRRRFGKIVRAGGDARAMVSALGINVQLVFAGAFLIGAMLAGFGGVLGGTMISLQPGQDTAFLLNSLIVVIIGGMGSLGGAAIGALALGLVSAYSDVYLVFGDTDLTNYSILFTFALLVIVLAARPLGLFGRPA
jgi:branched-chain amino acid transport system permease protein